MSLRGKTLFITGASRGIGLAIGVRAAKDGANVAIIAKTAEPNPKLPGTIFSAAKEIEEAGGKALPIQCDIRFEDQVTAAVAKTVTGGASLDLAIAGVAVPATVGIIAWRNRVWNRGGNPTGSPGRPNKNPLEPYSRE